MEVRRPTVPCKLFFARVEKKKKEQQQKRKQQQQKQQQQKQKNQECFEPTVEINAVVSI